MSDRSGLVTLYAKKEPFDMDNVLLGWFLAVRCPLGLDCS